jgi:hypothetical protein
MIFWLTNSISNLQGFDGRGMENLRVKPAEKTKEKPTSITIKGTHPKRNTPFHPFDSLRSLRAFRPQSTQSSQSNPE